MTKIGFVGLGIMGRAMARNVINGGYEVYMYDRKTPPQELVDLGGRICADAAEVATLSDIVITMVPDTPDVEAALFGENGVAAGLTAGKIVVDMSSISPLQTKIFAARIKELGCEYLDAPVSGGEVGAVAGSLTIMVGGSQDAFDKVKPVLEKMGKNITLIGGNGDGQTTKVANQIIVALTIEAVAEALLFASKAGANVETVRKALMGGFANSRILEVHGERMVKRNFEPGFRIALHRKDLNLAVQGAQEMSLSLPHTASCLQMLNAAYGNGSEGLDHSAILTVLERASNAQLQTNSAD